MGQIYAENITINQGFNYAPYCAGHLKRNFRTAYTRFRFYSADRSVLLLEMLKIMRFR